MVQKTLKEIEKLLEGTLFGCDKTIINNISTNSKQISEQCLFIPLKGEKFDGHNFINDAIKSGAVALISHKILNTELPYILVENTSEALCKFAENFLAEKNLHTVAVTGSVGKTTTKEMISSVLSQKYKTHKTLGNFNNDIGLPLTILNTPEHCEAIVLEMGMNHSGEIRKLSNIAKPDITVITNIGVSHIEYLGSRENIANAKLEILEGQKPSGLCVFNGDEPLLNGKLNKGLYFGIQNTNCNITAVNILFVNSEMTFDILYEGKKYPCHLNVTGKHNVLNALCAFGVGILSDIAPEKILKGLYEFKNADKRQNIYEKNGFTIIDDCYNASPDSIYAALNVLNELNKGKKIAILGGMGELGDYSKTAHTKCGEYAAQFSDILICYKDNGEYYKEGAIRNGMSEHNIIMCENHAEVCEKLHEIAQKNDILLFKGSRFMKMEEAIKLFLGDKHGNV